MREALVPVQTGSEPRTDGDDAGLEGEVVGRLRHHLSYPGCDHQ